jgi:hypothetical protein
VKNLSLRANDRCSRNLYNRNKQECTLPRGLRRTSNGLTRVLKKQRTASVESAVSDVCFAVYLSASEDDAEAQLERLLAETVRPLLPQCLPRSLSGKSALTDDVLSEAYLNLVTRFRRLRAPDSPPIRHLESYMRAVLRTAYERVQRQNNPEWSRLRLRVRYALDSADGLAVWETQHLTVCGYAIWEDAAIAPLGSEEAETRLRGFTAPTASLPELCAAIFDRLNAPAELNTLVTILSTLLGSVPSLYPLPPAVLEQEHDRRFALSSEDIFLRYTDDRALLHRIWQEAQNLPPRQRLALLLNLRDTSRRGILELFTVSGIVTWEEMRETMEKTLREAEILPSAEGPDIWESLRERIPLRDEEIAALLGASRQQVINLRKVARERLLRKFGPLPLS